MSAPVSGLVHPNGNQPRATGLPQPQTTTDPKGTRTVAVVQTVLTRYRVPMLERLRAALAAENVELRVIHGTRSPRTAAMNDEGSLPWATVVRTRWMFLPGLSLIWQPIRQATRDCDLVVMPQHNRILSNWSMALVPAGRRIAFWGHGRKFQRGSRLRAALRRRLALLPDWWFAYTELSKSALLEAGFPAGRITVVQNTIDTANLREALANVSAAAVAELRDRLGFRGATGIFCGTLYPGKRLDFLIKAAIRIKERCPDFVLVILGSGPDAESVRRQCAGYPWIHLPGATFGIEKALYLRTADVFLIPYSAGLSLLDAFCAGLPVVAVEDGEHGPEIAYLHHGRNGLLTPAAEEAYVANVVNLLADRPRLANMSAAATESAVELTLERMVERFASGIVAALRVLH